MTENNKPGTGFSDIHMSHMLEFVGNTATMECSVCSLNTLEDEELLKQECVRDESDKAPSTGSRIEQIQAAMSEAMSKVTESVNKKFAELAKVGPDMDQQLKAKMLVVWFFNSRNDADHDFKLKIEDVYVVWYNYTLGGWKALLSTEVRDGKYYELTYNRLTEETYIDCYRNVENVGVTDIEFLDMFGYQIEND